MIDTAATASTDHCSRTTIEKSWCECTSPGVVPTRMTQSYGDVSFEALTRSA